MLPMIDGHLRNIDNFVGDIGKMGMQKGASSEFKDCIVLQTVLVSNFRNRDPGFQSLTLT